MYCEYCNTCGSEIVGTSAFATMSTHFKHESLKKHCHSSMHKKCRDKYVVSVVCWLLKPSNGNMTVINQFNTAFTIAKEELTFTKFKPMLDSAPF